MKVLVDLEDEDSVFIRLDRESIGLAYDVLDDMYGDRGLLIGTSNTVELSLPRYLARQLREALNGESI